jgi:hypothetical protein
MSGWALACGRSPAQVFLLADGLAVGRTTRFTTRPDVESRMRTRAPSGWTVSADTHGLAPGEHVLQVAVRAEPLADVRIVSESRVRLVMEEPASTPSLSADESEPLNVVTAGDLAPLAQRAAELVRKHQNAGGYWLTAHTTATKFESPEPEMNTFLTAMVVDLLTPIAARYGLEDSLGGGRRHLAAQIEPDGLVRYHGRPDGPTIGTLGCAITPDADDTALAWRIAAPPVDDPRRAPMLRTLESYRDARGLYRTWLAPQDRYQCIDPGRDPDPADVAIQMHVLLLLAEIDHDAAVPLCQALARHVSDDSLWVYYARAPIVPLLRITDLRRIGCGLELPSQRLAGVPGQEVWIAATRRLVHSELNAPGARSSQERRAALELLAALGRDDFAALRRTPPLLYHNDLTATVSRYYWSEDFGYALWLRLYEAMRAAPSTAAPP